ncbi:MAG: DUF4337 family protein [Alphaproteobacteria bacterium]|nr:DUF4337 family protein [Alphaproteobacteria bacterium]
MVEPGDAKELIDDAIERAEERHDREDAAERAAERKFRNSVSVMVGVFAVALAVIHMAASSAARDTLVKSIEASDTYNYMQAKIIREAVFNTAGASSAFDSTARARWTKEAMRLRRPDAAGHGIEQLRKSGDEQREESVRLGRAGEGYELGETALQMAIVLLSIALVAQSRKIVAGALLLAVAGTCVAIATAIGISIP